MKAALLEIGTWLRDETILVEDVAEKAYTRLTIGEDVTRKAWSEVTNQIRMADWPKFAAMSGMMWQEMVAGERYERFKELLCKAITDYWVGWLEQRRRDQGLSSI